MKLIEKCLELLEVFMGRFDLVCVSESIICTNCGLEYSTKEHESCSHCHFTINHRPIVEELQFGY